MCGIAAHFVSTGDAAPLDLALIHHRGPDGNGEWHSPDGRFWVGSTRLAIIDLSPTGAQPMTDPETGNVIVTNGEIYNHPAVRNMLGPDLAWRGTSDTETILRGYGRWGHAVLDRIKGMFAFAIYDAARNELFVARDRLGIKPLYYAAENGEIRFASEIKMLTEAVEAVMPEATAAYLEWGACPENQLLYQGIQSLPAGHAMTISSSGQTRMWRYWPSQLAFVSKPDNAAPALRKLIETAVEEHLLSDVPVASFLSGGIDSSVITALAAQRLGGRLQTYSVGFDIAAFDETEIASEIAQRYRTDHHRIELSEEEVIEAVTEAVTKLDLPSVDAINTYIVARAVASRKVKVALSGLGGDELFGGYPSFRDVPRLQLLSTLPGFLRRLVGLVGNLGDRLADLPASGNTVELAAWRRRFFTDAAIGRAGLPLPRQILETPTALPDDFGEISWAELTGYMRHMLLRDSDQMSMAVSLELRVPFLDHELVEYVLGLPAGVKKRYPGVKGLLVQACRDLLPPSVYDRPKAGFVLPMQQWMRGPLASFVSEGLSETTTRELLPESFVQDLAGEFHRDRLHWSRLWSIVVLGHYARRCNLTRAETEPFRATANISSG
ncbi:MAG TPA: asparagine synthase (glutamine-hydrolyzing) [Chthoniobacterales bacterium]|jgi:asparagine synthase (glutamine-hydrolysing)|nr:asparagine synthase (glutamine-hydrolyzing) [Chthoniobacterales bacterium]